MKKGWYILNYHDISWEESIWMRGIGGTFAPDIFQEQLEILSKSARPVSIEEGFKRFLDADIDEPLVSFWFDDGFRGVRKYAMPIMKEYSIEGAVSINSRFALREEMFWRAKLSFLAHSDASRLLRSRLKKFAFRTGREYIKAFTLDHFSRDIVEIIDELYEEFCPEHSREDAFRIFDTFEGIRTLLENGWEICNHSSAHYPISEESYIHRFTDEFIECEEAIERELGISTRFWGLPFDRKSVDIAQMRKLMDEKGYGERTLVMVGNRVNIAQEKLSGTIFRIEAPSLPAKDYPGHLSCI